ncbi:MAG: iron ABC transporter permease [Anaerolineaceae bacterium]|nr:iron ABC transporter permease [Anaerolineae bacterium]MCB9459662.1 iron ABC transporter permease [Anaerolineaceae bacterium]
MVLLVMIFFVIVAILLPLLAMIGASVSPEGIPVFSEYLTSHVYLEIIRNTLVLGAVIGTTGTAVGFLMAFVQVKLDVPFKRFMHIVSLVPVISPPFALATATIVLFGRNGSISRGLFGVRYDIYGLDGLAIVMTLSFFTISYLNLRGMMLALDPALDEAATNLGANKWRIFRTVTLPMLMPGIASSFLLLFVEAIADLGNPLVMAGNYEVLATRIYVTIIGLYDTTGAAVLSVILLVPSLSVFIVQRYWISRMSVVSVTGKPSGTPQTIDHPFVKWSLFGLAMGICLLIVLIYGTIVHGAFVTVPGVRWDWTLDHFDFVINGIGSQAMRDTTTLSVIATPIAGLVGMVIAFLVVRKEFFGRSALDFGTMLGIAVPGTIIGIGYILMFNTPVSINLPLLGDIDLIPKLTGGRAVFGGALAIVLVYVVRSTPAALRSGTAALSQIDPSIEEASISLGADSARTFRRITLPLIRPAFLAGLIYAFARSMTTISAIIFLTTPQTKIMTQQILNEVENGRYGNAFAYCVILIGIVMVAISVLYFLVGSTTGTEQRIEGGL